MRIKPDGAFTIQEQENTLFEMNEYSAYVDIFEEAKALCEEFFKPELIWSVKY